MPPYKNVTRKEYKLMLKPWITKEILQTCKMRDSLIKSISKENDPAQITSLRIDYKKMRNEITKEKRDLCFEVGVFPEILKLAKVTPLHKKESKLDFLNCRPISLLSVFSKIYEKLIYIRIYSYLDKNNLIYNKQFGFRSNYSTNHAILSVIEHICSLLDTGYYVCGILLI